MPQQFWRSTCRCFSVNTFMGSPDCRSCGQPGQYVGWQLGMYEAMWAYTKRTGLTPIGPHRRLSGELFEGRFGRCETCDGQGVLDVDNGRSWSECPDCHLVGTFFKGAMQEFLEIRSRIIAQYPRASSPSFAPDEWIVNQRPGREWKDGETKLRIVQKGFAPEAEVRCIFYTLVVRNQALKMKWPGGPADYWGKFKTIHNADLSACCFKELACHDQYRELIRHGLSEGGDFILFDAARTAASMGEFEPVLFSIVWLGGYVHKAGVMVFLKH